MNKETAINKKLQTLFQPSYLEVENESHKHSVPKGSESHFRVLIVSEKFEGLSRVDRQRLVNECLKEELNSGLHALGQRTLTASEWEKLQGQGPLTSPDCHSKKKTPSAK